MRVWTRLNTFVLVHRCNCHCPLGAVTAVDSLADCLSDGQSHVRAAAAKALGYNLGPRLTISITTSKHSFCNFCNLREHNDNAQQCRGLHFLTGLRFHCHSPEAKLAESTQQAQCDILSGASRLEREWATEQRWPVIFEPRGPRLTQSLKDSDHVVRRSAAVSLGRIGQLVWREASWKSAWSVPQEHCKKSGLHVGLCLSNVGGYFAPTFTILGLHVGTILGLCWAILAILRSVSVLAFILDLGISVSLSFGPWQAFANNTVDTKKNVFMVCSTIFSFPLGHAALRPCWPYLKLICCVLLSPLPLWSVAGL